MLLFWLVGRKLNNIWLKRMPLAMIPYTLSGFCALIYHVTLDEWEWLSEVQAYLTFSGSCCFALWAFLLLRDVTKQHQSKISCTRMVENHPSPNGGKSKISAEGVRRG